MTQDNFLSAIRAILTMVGSYLVGHAVFGHTVSADTWQVILGSAMAVASTGWSIYDKTATHDSIIAALRQVALAIGGLFVSAGVISSDQLNSILGVVLMLATIIQGYAHKSMIANISSGNLNASGNGKVAPKIPLIAFLLVMLCFTSKSQSLLKPLPPYKAPVTRFARIIGPTDSLPSISTRTWQGFRFAGPDILVAIPDFSLWTGLGIDYVWAVANTSTNKWDYNYTLGIRATGGANLGSPTVRTIGGAGIRATFFKGFLALGAIYNFTLKHPQAAVGNPAAVIPGLN